MENKIVSEEKSMVMTKIGTQKKPAMIFVGRRKTSVARVHVRNGSGRVLVNGKEGNSYFCRVSLVKGSLLLPISTLPEALSSVDMLVSVRGGGVSGQSGAACHAISRALKYLYPSHASVLRKSGLLTRDSREVERKHYGHKKARKSFQFSKR